MDLLVANCIRPSLIGKLKVRTGWFMWREIGLMKRLPGIERWMSRRRYGGGDMASIGMINIGGRDDLTQTIEFHSAVVFLLDSLSKINKIFYFQDNEWELEVKSGNHSIVARSHLKLSVDVLLSKGFELCQQALDILSVERKGNMQIKKPGEEHIVLFMDHDKVILRESSFNDLFMGVEASITKVDRDGNIILDPPSPEINWIPAFRFYRFSQASNDLFEAYRNLYLGLEAILNQICPKGKRERERQWLERALNLISDKIRLPEIMKDTSDPVESFITNQYVNVRCKLFHAKGNKAIIPHQDLNPVLISKAYAKLIAIWREIATVYYSIPGGGGAITNIGFKSMMDAAFKNEFSFIATNDKTPPKDEDEGINHGMTDIYSYDIQEYDSNSIAGQALLKGYMEKANITKVKVVYKTGIKVGDILYLIHLIPDGLNLTGIDRFESYQTVRLVNKSLGR